MFGRFARAVQGCMDAGLAPRDDAAFVATVLWAGLHGIVDLRLGKPGFPWPPVDVLVDRVIRGLVGVEPEGDDAPKPG